MCITRRSLLRWAVTGTAGAAVMQVSGCSDPQVVVTGQVDPSRAAAYREMAVRGVREVGGLWGRGRVPLPVRLHLPRSSAQWAQATGHRAGERGYAGTTVRRPGHDSMVVVHPEVWEALTPEGRAGVLTHEIAHLAMGPSRRAPWWLTEGLAEYTAHRGTDHPARIAGSALPRLRADPPAGWPQAPEGSDPWQGYAAAWLACLFLARQIGEQPLLQAYAATRAGGSWPQVSRSSLGRPASRLHQQWLRWLATLDEPAAAPTASRVQEGV